MKENHYQVKGVKKRVACLVCKNMSLTNLQLRHLGCEHLQLHGPTAPIAILCPDDQPDLTPGVQASHCKLGAHGGYVGEHLCTWVDILQNDDGEI